MQGPLIKNLEKANFFAKINQTRTWQVFFLLAIRFCGYICKDFVLSSNLLSRAHAYYPGQSIWSEIKKLCQIRQSQKVLIPAFTKFLTVICNVLSLGVDWAARSVYT